MDLAKVSVRFSYKTNKGKITRTWSNAIFNDQEHGDAHLDLLVYFFSKRPKDGPPRPKGDWFSTSDRLPDNSAEWNLVRRYYSNLYSKKRKLVKDAEETAAKLVLVIHTLIDKVNY